MMDRTMDVMKQQMQPSRMASVAGSCVCVLSEDNEQCIDIEVNVNGFDCLELSLSELDSYGTTIVDVMRVSCSLFDTYVR